MVTFSGISTRFPRLIVWLETLGLTLLIPLVGTVLNRDDPFFVKAEFPWLWLGSLLVALRYGIAPALSSVSLVMLLWFGAVIAGLVSGAFPLHFMLGGVLLALLAGQFSTSWSTRLRRSDQLSRHASERFQQLSRAYFMVRHSHDRLEQNLVSRPVTLRQAMMELRRLLVEKGGVISPELAGELMVILAHYCSLSSAAIYAVRHGVPDLVPLAQCGQGAPCLPDDLLVRSALESGTTAYQAANRLGGSQHSSYLAAAPLCSSSGHLLGVVLVSDMPFMALHRETLQILGVLLAYAADHVEAAATAKSVTTIYPDCPTVFGAELIKMIRLKRDLDIVSTLVVINLPPGPQLDELCQVMERQQRGLDHGWRRDLGWGVQFVTLMPFSGPAAMEGYQARLNEVLKGQFKITLQGAGISLKYAVVSADEPVVQLANLLTEEV
ncbi:MAG: PelD GGDEF domain-containing protein [Trichlorobacter sp.]|uniref:PelD GGDEF domain-containing protein n=1 Tax=Trichlorobacter sp. TaxID=2911007 RepID=UPI002566562D|nr:PelD GGDEF domain-containing protein [Trichlorobacter sp.]MDK9716440.1 PelD GGDEF domain-containing protein [Trichlorobacter sp.]